MALRASWAQLLLTVSMMSCHSTSLSPSHLLFDLPAILFCSSVSLTSSVLFLIPFLAPFSSLHNKYPPRALSFQELTHPILKVMITSLITSPAFHSPWVFSYLSSYLPSAYLNVLLWDLSSSCRDVPGET